LVQPINRLPDEGNAVTLRGGREFPLCVSHGHTVIMRVQIGVSSLLTENLSTNGEAGSTP